MDERQRQTKHTGNKHQWGEMQMGHSANFAYIKIRVEIKTMIVYTVYNCNWFNIQCSDHSVTPVQVDRPRMHIIFGEQNHKYTKTALKSVII